MLLPLCLSAKPFATFSSVGFWLGSSPVPRQQYQRSAAGAKDGIAKVWGAVAWGTSVAAPAEEPAVAPPDAWGPAVDELVEHADATSRTLASIGNTRCLGFMSFLSRSRAGAGGPDSRPGTRAAD